MADGAARTLTLVPGPIEEYAAAHSEPLPPLLRELIEETQREFGALAGMISGQLAGGLLQTIVAATRAERVLEIGCFTGFSALMMAAALPEHGWLTTCDVNPKAIAVARRYFARSPYEARIDLREGPAIETMRTLEGPFDVIFIDADKQNYVNYYEASLPLLAASGVIVVDNVLWSGRVLQPREPDDVAIAAFNEHVRADGRVSATMLTVRDGMTVIRRRN